MEKRVLITLAESVEEALSDFVGYVENDLYDIDENSIRKLSDAEIGSDIVNLIEFDNALPEDFDGWFAVDAEMSYEKWCNGINRNGEV
jgi:hypothetical protein